MTMNGNGKNGVRTWLLMALTSIVIAGVSGSVGYNLAARRLTTVEHAVIRMEEKQRDSLERIVRIDDQMDKITAYIVGDVLKNRP